MFFYLCKQIIKKLQEDSIFVELYFMYDPKRNIEYEVNENDTYSEKKHIFIYEELILYRFKTPTKIIKAQFRLTPYPNCCGIYILSDVYSIKPGIGTSIFNFTIAHCIKLCKGVVQFVVNEHMPRAKKSIEKHLNLEHDITVKNPNSGNRIYVYNYDISKIYNDHNEYYKTIAVNILKSTKLFNINDYVEVLKEKPIT